MNVGRENEFVEFKKTTSEIKEGIISAAAILNKHGKGTLYFGVKDNGDVTGQETGKDTLRNISRAFSENIRPSCMYEIEQKRSFDGKDFVEVNFSGDRRPYSAYGRYYQRFADEDRIISDFELEKMFQNRKKDYSEWENADSDVSIEEIDEELLKYAVRRGTERGRIKEEYADDREILSKFGLLHRETGRLNNAGNVLFSKDSPVLLKLATFATETKHTFIKLEHYRGNVFQCVQKALEYILGGIDWNIEFSGDPQRKETPEIPAQALREIVVNAFCHGFYDGSTAFEVDIYKNRVTVYSPGDFPAGCTPEEFAEGEKDSVMLNPKIMNVLYRTGVIESFGTGFERTFSECRKEGTEYRYENTGLGFRFEFFRKPVANKKQDELTKTQIQVLRQIMWNDLATQKEIADRIGKSSKTVYRAVSKLKEQGYIEREGSDHNGRWKVLKREE